jgi:hypothetical protein
MSITRGLHFDGIELIRTLNLSETDYNRCSDIIDHIRHESAEPFEEFMIANFNPTFSIDDSYQYRVAMKDDRIQHIFKTAELFSEAFDSQTTKR